MVKNPNWQEADQLASYKRGRGVELGSTKKQLQLSGQSGTRTRDLGFKVRRPNHSATLPPASLLTHRCVWFIGANGKAVTFQLCLPLLLSLISQMRKTFGPFKGKINSVMFLLLTFLGISLLSHLPALRSNM